MNQVVITKAIVCAGYNNAPAIKFSNTSAGELMCQFKVGEEIYDSKAENNRRYNNWRIRCFGDTAERIKKMNLMAGSKVNIFGKFDNLQFEDINGSKHDTIIITLSNIEYAAPLIKKDADSKKTTNEVEAHEEVTTADSDCKVVNLDDKGSFFGGSL